MGTSVVGIVGGRVHRRGITFDSLGERQHALGRMRAGLDWIERASGRGAELRGGHAQPLGHDFKGGSLHAVKCTRLK